MTTRLLPVMSIPSGIVLRRASPPILPVPFLSSEGPVSCVRTMKENLCISYATIVSCSMRNAQDTPTGATKMKLTAKAQTYLENWQRYAKTYTAPRYYTYLQRDGDLSPKLDKYGQTRMNETSDSLQTAMKWARMCGTLVLDLQTGDTLDPEEA